MYLLCTYCVLVVYLLLTFHSDLVFGIVVFFFWGGLLFLTTHVPVTGLCSIGHRTNAGWSHVASSVVVATSIVSHQRATFDG